MDQMRAHAHVYPGHGTQAFCPVWFQILVPVGEHAELLSAFGWVSGTGKSRSRTMTEITATLIEAVLLIFLTMAFSTAGRQL